MGAGGGGQGGVKLGKERMDLAVMVQMGSDPAFLQPLLLHSILGLVLV